MLRFLYREHGQEVKQEAKGVEEKKEYDIPDEVEEVIEELAG